MRPGWAEPGKSEGGYSLKSTKNSFEGDMVLALNAFLRKGKTGKAYRLRQSRYQSQFLDILVDSAESRYYLGIECKSINAVKYKKLYWATYFSQAGGIHQLERISKFLQETGRKGLLAVELRNGTGKKREAYLLPFKWVYEQFKTGINGLSVDEIREEGTRLLRAKGAYEVKEGMI